MVDTFGYIYYVTTVTETWATTKQQEARIDVNEMRMIRCICRVISNDNIGNVHIPGTIIEWCSFNIELARREDAERRGDEHIPSKSGLD